MDRSTERWGADVPAARLSGSFFIPASIQFIADFLLMALGIVQKETPYGEKASKKTIYAIDDNMFRFWYRFVPENASMIARGAADLVYKRIEPHLPE